jgi:hypothetical protein
MPIALILVDALAAAYVSHATLPTLYEFSDGGTAGPLENIYAYRGIEATLFSGRYPSEHGVWGEFCPANRTRPEKLSERLGRGMIQLGDMLPSDRLRLNVRYVVSRLQRGNDLLPTSNLIPARLLPRFDSSLERAAWDPRSLGAIPTLFDELRACGKSFETLVYPEVMHDHQLAGMLRARIAQRALPDFWYIKFSALDALGHRYGPDLAQLGPALEALDSQIAELIEILRSAYAAEPIDIVVLSDHGMSQVEQAIDVRPILKRIERMAAGELLYFLDSTTIRIWSASPSVCEAAAGMLADVPGLRVLGSDDRRALRIPDDSATGDVLAACDEGLVIFPDFFRKQSAPLGMHGYATVNTAAGMPYAAVGAPLVALLPRTRLTHTDIWAAISERLGFGMHAGAHGSEEQLCIS